MLLSSRGPPVVTIPPIKTDRMGQPPGGHASSGRGYSTRPNARRHTTHDDDEKTSTATSDGSTGAGGDRNGLFGTVGKIVAQR